MTVKGNMPTLYRQLKLPWARIRAVSSVSTTTAAGSAARSRPSWRRPGSGFAGAAQVAQLRRTVTRKGK